MIRAYKLSQLLNSGYDAVKEVFSNSKVIIHLDQGDNRNRFIEFFDKHNYWEPQGAFSWSKYKLNCWREDGSPSKALKAFID